MRLLELVCEKWGRQTTDVVGRGAIAFPGAVAGSRSPLMIVQSLQLAAARPSRR